MTQWAAEVLLALRAAGWPEPNYGPRPCLETHYRYSALNGMITIGDAEARVISLSDHLSVAGPPRAVAQTLSYWRDIAG